MAIELDVVLSAFRKRKEQWLVLALLIANVSLLGLLFLRPSDTEEALPPPTAPKTRKPADWNFETRLSGIDVPSVGSPSRRNPFHSVRPEPTARPVSKPKTDVPWYRAVDTNPVKPSSQDPTPTPRPTPAPITVTLTGVMAGPTGQRIAMLYDPEKDTTVLVRTGDTIQGAKVVEISRKELSLDDPARGGTLLLEVAPPPVRSSLQAEDAERVERQSAAPE